MFRYLLSVHLRSMGDLGVSETWAMVTVQGMLRNVNFERGKLRKARISRESWVADLVLGVSGARDLSSLAVKVAWSSCWFFGFAVLFMTDVMTSIRSSEPNVARVSYNSCLDSVPESEMDFWAKMGPASMVLTSCIIETPVFESPLSIADSMGVVPR